MSSQEENKKEIGVGNVTGRANLCRLQSFLKNDTLAHRLVTGWLSDEESEGVLSDIVNNRLQEVRSEYETPPDKKH